MSLEIFTNYREVDVNETFIVQNVSYPSTVQIDFGDGEIRTFENTSLIEHSYSVAGDYEIKVFDFSGISLTLEEIYLLVDELGNFTLSGDEVLATNMNEALETSTEDELLKVGTFNETFNINDFVGNTMKVSVIDEIEEFSDDELTNRYEDLSLPYDEIKISSNQIITEQVLNSVYSRLYDNFEYVKNTQTRYIDSFDNGNEFVYQLSSDIGTGDSVIEWESQYNLSSTAGTDIRDIKSSKDFFYIVDGIKLFAFDFKRKRTEKIYLTSGKYNYQFTDIRTINVKEDNEFYILDAGTKLYRLRVLNEEDLRLIAYKFFDENVSDVVYDESENVVFVVLNGSTKIQKFSENFELLAEIEAGGVPLKLAANESNLFVYNQTGIISTFDKNLTRISDLAIGEESNFKRFKTKITYSQFENVKKFAIDSYGYYFYLCLDDIVIKIGRNGKLVSAITEADDLRSIHLDNYGNIFVAAETRIEKYYSGITIQDLRNTSIADLYQKEDFYFYSKETVASWIYNEKSIKFLKMLENFILSLQYRLTINYQDFDIEGFSKTDISYSSLINLIDYANSNYLIGSNEIVSSVVINRYLKFVNDIIKGLFESVKILRDYNYSATFYLPNLLPPEGFLNPTITGATTSGFTINWENNEQIEQFGIEIATDSNFTNIIV